jgi:hypothetical protein
MARLRREIGGAVGRLRIAGARRLNGEFAYFRFQVWVAKSKS